ncbi:MAG: MFS transporter [Oligoflexia bacterium]|nr:MFS transporter [Oligoflexia bacterium]
MNEPDKNRRSVIWIGMVSFFNDLSSEVVSKVLPIYLVTVFNTSAMGLGLIEGISEALSVITKLFSGIYSDKIQKRKPLVFLGYAMSIVGRSFIVLSTSAFGIGVIRVFDRLGKGIRGAPRDALIVDLSTKENLGENFGINRALDSLGSVIGLGTLALILPLLNENDEVVLTQVLLIAAAAGILALIVLALFVHEPKVHKAIESRKFTFNFKKLHPKLKHYLFIAFIFALANSSDSFLILRAKKMGFSLREIFMIMTAFNVVTVYSSYKISKISDKLGRKYVMIFGWLTYAVSYFFIGLPGLTNHAFVGLVCLYGLFYGFTESVEKALVADYVNKDNKGESYGWLSVVNALGIVPANIIFASIFDSYGVQWAFWASATFALLGVILLIFFKERTSGEINVA